MPRNSNNGYNNNKSPKRGAYVWVCASNTCQPCVMVKVRRYTAYTGITSNCWWDRFACEIVDDCEFKFRSRCKNNLKLHNDIEYRIIFATIISCGSMLMVHTMNHLHTHDAGRAEYDAKLIFAFCARPNTGNGVRNTNWHSRSNVKQTDKIHLQRALYAAIKLFHFIGYWMVKSPFRSN